MGQVTAHIINKFCFYQTYQLATSNHQKNFKSFAENDERNQDLKLGISQLMSELSPLIIASENHMPVDNLLAYVAELGI